MKQGILGTFLVVFSSMLTCTYAGVIIPAPLSEEVQEGRLVLPAKTAVAFPEEAASLYTQLLNEAGLEVVPAKEATKANIRFQALSTDGKVSPEAYELNITKQGVVISANTPAGRLYGVQSLCQWIEAEKTSPAGERHVGCVKIKDAPRFAWRGYMLDESRHFSGEAAVKRLLDGMARYKMNRFHWHLTDSPGWRIEIKKYPKLTEIGGRGSETDRRPDAPAQFYTQEQIKDIVAYAKVRGIKVIPEIDMPGHADAAIHAYPANDGGGFDRWPHFTFNPAKAETLAFLDDVLAEVASLFPDAGIIHFGGDEAHFGWHHWPQLPEVKALMKEKNYSQLTEVEAWFNRRMAGSINKLGYQTGGWDEIVARDLPVDKTVVFWWRQDKRDVLDKALAAGYPVILCPRLPCYLDFIQDPAHRAGRFTSPPNTLQRCYEFPAELKLTAEQLKNVQGLQGNLWTEHTVTQERRDFMTWPRIIALAEAGWSTAERKDYQSFEERIKLQLVWLEKKGITYYDPFKRSADIVK